MEPTALNPIAMTAGLLGGLALFLYGIEKLTTGLKAAAGSQMRMLLAKLTKNPALGAITGAFVTAVIQSSSVTTVLVVGFVSAGLMTLVQSIGVIFGANVGTTITAQIVAFNVTAAALPLIAVGFFLIFADRSERSRHVGGILMGLGLIFYGMDVMGDAMSPLRSNQAFMDLMQAMERPLLGLLVGAVFTALVQSSSATISLAVVMATEGLVTLSAGIPLVFGAKIGTCVTALLASLGKPRDALRAAAVHVIYNVAGAVLWLAFIDQLAAIAVWASPSHPELTGVARFEAEVPRQIANAATIWATVNMLLFLPLAGIFGRVVTRLVPDRPADTKVLVEPRFLDPELIQVPALALERVRLELGHMAEIIGEMLTRTLPAMESRDSSEPKRLHDQVVILDDAMLEYLRDLGRENLTDEESEEHAKLAYACSELESMSGVIAHELAPLAEDFARENLEPSEATGALLRELYGVAEAAARQGLVAIIEGDESAAQQVVAQRDPFWRLGGQLLRQQAAQLAGDDPARLVKHRLQVDVLDKLRRIYSLAEHMAVSVLPRGALTAERGGRAVAT